MVTTRTPIRRAGKTRITPEAVALFKKALVLEASGDDADIWESDGGRRREYLNARVALHFALGRKLWHEDIMDIDGDEPPARVVRDGAERVEDWKRAAAIRRQLEKAAKA